LRVWLDLGATPLLGPGRVALLEAIADTGSISAAGRRLRMSYHKAWSLVAAMNRVAPAPLVERATGGRGGGGARLTPMGEELVRRFRALEAAVASRGRTEEPRLRHALSSMGGAGTGRRAQRARM
jgi:molybdate transport system regulatory protein